MILKAELTTKSSYKVRNCIESFGTHISYPTGILGIQVQINLGSDMELDIIDISAGNALKTLNLELNRENLLKLAKLYSNNQRLRIWDCFKVDLDFVKEVTQNGGVFYRNGVYIVSASNWNELSSEDDWEILIYSSSVSKLKTWKVASTSYSLRFGSNLDQKLVQTILKSVLRCKTRCDLKPEHVKMF